MNRLNHKLRKARGEVSHLRSLVRYRNGELREHIDPSIVESYTKTKEEIRYFVAIRESIRKGYRRVKE